jgi:hypothetical protein
MITELKTTSSASLRAAFSFGRTRQVRIELDIGFARGDERSEDRLSEIARIIDGSRFHQRTEPDCGECDWHQVLNLIRRCHDEMRSVSSHLITTIRIEDGESATRELQAGSLLAESAAAVTRAI